MLLVPAEKLPEGRGWTYELKLDELPRTRDQDRRDGTAPLAERQRLQREVPADREGPRCPAGRDRGRWRGCRARPRRAPLVQRAPERRGGSDDRLLRVRRDGPGRSERDGGDACEEGGLAPPG